MLLHLINTYCLPTLLHSCEIWPLNTVNMHERAVIWNNCYIHVFTRCWQEGVKPLQYYCESLPVSYLVYKKQLLFFRKLSYSNNTTLRAILALPMVRYEALGLASIFNIYL